jgi:hypothetical protein
MNRNDSTLIEQILNETVLFKKEQLSLEVWKLDNVPETNLSGTCRGPEDELSDYSTISKSHDFALSQVLCVVLSTCKEGGTSVSPAGQRYIAIIRIVLAT